MWCLRPTCGEHAVPVSVLARAALPPEPLLTHLRALVWQRMSLNFDLPPTLVNVLADYQPASDH